MAINEYKILPIKMMPLGTFWFYTESKLTKMESVPIYKYSYLFFYFLVSVRERENCYYACIEKDREGPIQKEAERKTEKMISLLEERLRERENI